MQESAVCPASDSAWHHLCTPQPSPDGSNDPQCPPRVALSVAELGNLGVASDAECYFGLIGCPDSAAANYVPGVVTPMTSWCQYGGCNDTEASNFEAKVCPVPIRPPLSSQRATLTTTLSAMLLLAQMRLHPNRLSPNQYQEYIHLNLHLLDKHQQLKSHHFHCQMRLLLLLYQSYLLQLFYSYWHLQ